MLEFVIPVAVVVAVGFISAVLLTFVGHKFAVPVDETQILIRDCLPGANCGACGFAGCDDYAAALAADHSIAVNKCTPGGETAAQGIAAILGVDAESSVPMVANVMCSGLADATKPEMDYQGLKSCAAVKQFFGGPGSCKYGCIGMGDCVAVCQYDAIAVCNGLAKVDRDSCVGCGMCASACPQNIIDIIPKALRVSVDCFSKEAGKVVRAVCSAGCIGCKLCEKECKFDAIHVVDNLARIDPEKCRSCGLCAKACPRKVIYVVPKPGGKPAPGASGSKEVTRLEDPERAKEAKA